MSEHEHSDGSCTSDTDEELGRDDLLRLNPFKFGSFSANKTRYMALFDCEQWAKQLSKLTFSTVFAAVSWEEATAVMHAYQERACGHSSKLTATDYEGLASLAEKITDLLRQLRLPGAGAHGEPDGFFIRLGPRSPKDAPALPSPNGVTEDRIREVLSDVFAGIPSLSDGDDFSRPHELLHRFQTACNMLLQVQTAAEAMALLTHSDRVTADIAHTQDCGKRDWNVSVVARTWDSRVKLEREFRCFVVQGRVVAITQYDDQLCYPFARDHGADIVHAITKAAVQLMPGLEELGFAKTAIVADYVVYTDADAEKCTLSARLIELNPFGPVTGASLFSWISDRRLLQGGVDLYGDLDDWEAMHPPMVAMPQVVMSQTFQDVQYRCLRQHLPSVEYMHLEALWPDYLRLAPLDRL